MVTAKHIREVKLGINNLLLHFDWRERNFFYLQFFEVSAIS